MNKLVKLALCLSLFACQPNDPVTAEAKSTTRDSVAIFEVTGGEDLDYWALTLGNTPAGTYTVYESALTDQTRAIAKNLQVPGDCDPAQSDGCLISGLGTQIAELRSDSPRSERTFRNDGINGNRLGRSYLITVIYRGDDKAPKPVALEAGISYAGCGDGDAPNVSAITP